jgi:hypothetical protein
MTAMKQRSRICTPSHDLFFSDDAKRSASPPLISLIEAQEIIETKTAPRVTVDAISDKIERTTYYLHQHLTIAIIEMANGFFVVGKAAPADPRNFDADVGKRYALEDAVNQLWELEGYALREQLAAQDVVQEQIGTNVSESFLATK